MYTVSKRGVMRYLPELVQKMFLAKINPERSIILTTDIVPSSTANHITAEYAFEHSYPTSSKEAPTMYNLCKGAKIQVEIQLKMKEIKNCGK